MENIWKIIKKIKNFKCNNIKNKLKNLIKKLWKIIDEIGDWERAQTPNPQKS